MTVVIDAPTRDELSAVAVAMASALRTDPGWATIVPDEDARSRALTTLLGHALRLSHRDGTVLVARDRGAVMGGIAWVAPGQYPRSRVREATLAPRMMAIAGRIGARTVRDLGRFGQAVDRLFPTEPVWYIQALCVAPTAQGQGLGTALLEPVLAKADATSGACYLETMRDANVAYYRRFGFTVLDAPELWDGGPTVWQMMRQPSGTRDAG